MKNLGIIGTGNIAGEGHARAILESQSVRLWSVLSRNLDRASSFAKKYEAQSPTPAYDSIEKFLDDPQLDGVIITSPDNLHFQHGMQVAKSNKPILMEKPFVTEYQDGLALLKFCEEQKVPLAIAYHLRWHNGHQKMLQAIRQDAIGSILMIRVIWTWKSADASNWRARPELGKWWSLAGVGTHCLDLARWILGDSCNSPEVVSGITSSPQFQSEHDEIAGLQIKTSSGALIDITTSAIIDCPPRVEVYGTKGYFICENTLGRHGTGKIYCSISGEVEFNVENPFKLQAENFARLISGDDPGMVSGAEGLANIDILCKATSTST